MIGILGGTFDPVHFGHLRLALEAQEVLGLQEVRFIPVAAPPHRAPPVATFEARCAMLKLALADAPGFVLDAIEAMLPAPSYTVRTLTALRASLGADPPLALLMGADAFAGLTSWHEWERLLELAHLVVATRPGTELRAERLPEPLARLWQKRWQVAEPTPCGDTARTTTHFADTAPTTTAGATPSASPPSFAATANELPFWRTRPAGAVIELPITPLAISSTHIRRLLASGRSARYLLPEAVDAYLRAQRIYG